MTGDVTVGRPLPPSDPYEAARWLRRRHAWLDELITRICGPVDQTAAWADDLAEAFNTLAANAHAWEHYQRRYPEPHDEAAWEAWQEAGPHLGDSRARRLAPMSGGEVRVLRLMTTLSSQHRCDQGWHVDDLWGLDERGTAIVADWIQIVRRQIG